MLKIISWFIIGVVYNISYCYFFTKLIKEKFYFSKNMIIYSIVFALANCYSIYYLPHIRPLVINMCAILLIIACYKKSVITSALAQIYTAIITGICELLFALIFYEVLKVDVQFFNENIIGLIIPNVIILFLTYIFINYVTLKKFKLFLTKNSNKHQDFNMIFLILFSFVTLSILLYPLSKVEMTFSTMTIYITTFLCATVFIIAFFNERNHGNKLSNKYDSLLQYVDIYEKLIDEKSKQQHENKNQLIIVRSMIEESKKNKPAVEYIDKLLNIEEENKDYNYLNKLKNIPTGIKGLIYYKIEQMKKLKIEVYLDVPKKLTKKNLKSCEANLKDLSKILGVYLDNAKEAASESLNKYVIIELVETKEYIEFNISNTYNGSINLDKIDKEGYTTKGKGHGYGLSLVNDIIKKNDIFSQSRNINGMYYVQNLKIKK